MAEVRFIEPDTVKSSTDLNDVFAFQNDTRYKRITQLMNMPRFYPLIYHFFLFIRNAHLHP